MLLVVEEAIAAAVGAPPGPTWETVMDQLNEAGFTVLDRAQSEALYAVLDALNDETDPSLELSMMRTVFADEL